MSVCVCVCVRAAHRDTFGFRSDVTLIGPKGGQVQVKRSLWERHVYNTMAAEALSYSGLWCGLLSFFKKSPLSPLQDEEYEGEEGEDRPL